MAETKSNLSNNLHLLPSSQVVNGILC